MFTIKRTVKAGIILILIIGAALVAIAMLTKKRPPSPLSSAPHMVTKEVVGKAVGLCVKSAFQPERNVFGLSTPYLNDELFAKLSDLNVPWIRMDLNWSLIEGNRGAYAWEYHDSLINEARKRNIKILLTVNGVPNWVTDWETFYTAYGSFLKKAVTRYQSKVDYWEIFNEPNLTGSGWLSWGDDPFAYTKEYATALAQGNAIIRSTDPAAFIVLGGLTSQPNAKDYMEELYALGVKNCFDIFAFHPYDFSGRFKEVVQAIRTVQAKYGDASKVIWFDEFGTDKLNEQEAVLTATLEERSAVGGVFWYTLFEPQGSTNMSLLDRKYNERPGYAILKDYFSK